MIFSLIVKMCSRHNRDFQIYSINGVNQNLIGKRKQRRKENELWKSPMAATMVEQGRYYKLGMMETMT